MWDGQVLLAPTEMFEDMLVEFDFKVGAKTSSVSLSSFSIGQFNSEKQILFFIQKQNENWVRVQELLMILKGRAELKPNSGSQTKMVRPSLFNEKVNKVERFVIIYKLYLKMRMKETTVEEQI